MKFEPDLEADLTQKPASDFYDKRSNPRVQLYVSAPYNLQIIIIITGYFQLTCFHCQCLVASLDWPPVRTVAAAAEIAYTRAISGLISRLQINVVH